MDFSVQVEGLDKISSATKRVQEQVIKELQTGLYASGLKVEKAAKESILNGNKTGRTYTRRTVTHQASAPGEAPASDTGRLANSITTYINKISGLEALIIAGRGAVKYAAMLEFGTRKIAPRPFMFPAFESSKAWIKERLAKSVNDGIKKATK